MDDITKEKPDGRRAKDEHRELKMERVTRFGRLASAREMLYSSEDS